MSTTNNTIENTIASRRLIIYHTTDCHPDYYWENNEVAIKLRDREIKTFEEYKSACGRAGCTCYNETVFIEYMNYHKELEAKWSKPMQGR